jgi:hypothetical protein
MVKPFCFFSVLVADYPMGAPEQKESFNSFLSSWDWVTIDTPFASMVADSCHLSPDQRCHNKSQGVTRTECCETVPTRRRLMLRTQIASWDSVQS